MSLETKSLRHVKAIQKRWYPNEDTTSLDRAIATDKILKYVRKIVDSAPPLTDYQKAQIRSLLGPSISDNTNPDAHGNCVRQHMDCLLAALAQWEDEQVELSDELKAAQLPLHRRPWPGTEQYIDNQAA